MFEKKPWLKFYGDTPKTIDYPRVTMYEAVLQTVEQFPDRTAYDFLDHEVTYRQFADQIDSLANALAALGMKKGDRITVAMPTCPQGIICFYAANKLGMVASMIHPLSTAKEIEFYLNVSKSTVALCLTDHFDKFNEVKENTPLKTIILTGLKDQLPGSSKPELPESSDGFKIVSWKDLLNGPYPAVPKVPMGTDEMAAILYSGGTTGHPKGIMLSNYNFITEGIMAFAFRTPSQREQPIIIVAGLPIFHGFGLGICCNAVFMNGGTSILVPIFTPDILADIIVRKRPNTVTGVPTLYDALTRSPVLQNADLSCLQSTTVGADTLPRTVKDRFEEAVRRQGGTVQLLEGYGLTEAVTGIMVTPMDGYREKSVGVPYPDMLAKVVRVGTREEVPPGEEGELCLNGPAVMLGYLDQPEETAKTLQKHEDGRTWLHTGDIFTMDHDGYFYFKLRLKRMIKSSGMNVYPAQVEAVLYDHPDVRDACVIGVPDEAQVERVKAFVVLKDNKKAGPDEAKLLVDHCRENLIKWSCPREVEFRESLPLTRVGKVAYTELEKQEADRLRLEGKFTGGK
ncbi:MAG: AMP-binding protein [Syntrophobacteraceae bacterium]